MVGHFVRLKLRLLANRLRVESVAGMIGFVLIWVAAVVVGALGGLAVFGLGRLVEEPLLALILGYTLTFVGWMVIPAAVSALDETLDPRRFELLPVAPRELAMGLLIGGAVGPGGVGTLIGLAVATFASFPSWSLAPVLVVVVLVELVLCLLVARLITTLFANLLASRRAREVFTLLIGLFAGSVVLTALVLDDSGAGRLELDIELTSLESLAFLGWTPPGGLARSPSLFASGEVVAGAGMVLYGLATATAIGWGWSRSMRRMMVTAPTVGRRAKRQGGRARTLALTPDWLRLRSGPMAGMVAKELRYVIRDNRVRSQLLGSAVPVVVIAFLSGNTLDGGAYNPFLAAGVAFIVVFSILANQFGMDGGSLWGYVVAPLPLADIVKGKNLGWALVASVPVVLIALGLALGRGPQLSPRGHLHVGRCLVRGDGCGKRRLGLRSLSHPRVEPIRQPRVRRRGVRRGDHLDAGIGCPAGSAGCSGGVAGCPPRPGLDHNLCPSRDRLWPPRLQAGDAAHLPPPGRASAEAPGRHRRVAKLPFESP